MLPPGSFMLRLGLLFSTLPCCDLRAPCYDPGSPCCDLEASCYDSALVHRCPTSYTSRPKLASFKAQIIPFPNSACTPPDAKVLVAVGGTCCDLGAPCYDLGYQKQAVAVCTSSDGRSRHFVPDWSECEHGGATRHPEAVLGRRSDSDSDLGSSVLFRPAGASVLDDLQEHVPAAVFGTSIAAPRQTKRRPAVFGCACRCFFSWNRTSRSPCKTLFSPLFLTSNKFFRAFFWLHVPVFSCTEHSFLLHSRLRFASLVLASTEFFGAAFGVSCRCCPHEAFRSPRKTQGYCSLGWHFPLGFSGATSSLVRFFGCICRCFLA